MVDTERKSIMLEREIEKVLMESIKKCGGYCVKFVSPGNDGVPDRVIIINGHVCFCELKTEAGKLSRLQKIQLSRIDKAGGHAFVIRGAKGIISFLQLIGENEESKRVERLLKRRYAQNGSERVYERGGLIYGEKLSRVVREK